MKANARNSLLAAVVLFAQCAAMGLLIWRYERIVRGGTEVRFRCEAYDPYDPLRGRYLHTTVRERCTNFAGFSSADEVKSLEGGDCRLYAKMEPSSNGLWRVAAVAKAPQPDGGLWVKPSRSCIERSLAWSDRGENEPYEVFEKRRKASPLVAAVTLPDRLFVNERIAPDAEKVLRDATSSKGAGAVAVYRVKDGEIVMTDIEIGGKPVTALAREKRGASGKGK